MQNNAPAVSLAEVYRTIKVPEGAGFARRKMFAFAGPGYLVAVGYMDPGKLGHRYRGRVGVRLYPPVRYFDFKFYGDPVAGS